MKVQLTDRFCAHAKSREAQTDYFDETTKGLALRVTKQGTKAWTFLHGTPRRRRITLGRYPTISLASARALAMEAKEGRTQVMTIATLTDIYLKALKGKRSFRQIERLLRRDVLPIIGSIPLRELHRRDVTRVVDAKAAPIAAKRAFDQLRAMIRWAVSRGDLDHNPIDGMKGPAASKPRERVLTDDEIRVLWQSLPQLRSPACQRVIKFCLVTGQRIGEVVGLRKAELDLAREVWNIPGSRTKNGHPHSVPLSPLALEIIGEGFDVVRRMYVSDTIRENQFGLPRWTAHDLRRTALTKMAELGVAPIVLGHVANHRTTTRAGVTLGVYVHHQYEREKRQALELWADRLQGIISGSDNVVALRRS
jgi:integrase